MQILGHWFWYFINDIVECCLQGSCFYFLWSDLTYTCRKNGNNKRIECLSNDSTVLISVLLCLCKSSILSITTISFRLSTDETRCCRWLFLIENFLPSTLNFAVCHHSCRWEVVKKLLSTAKSNRFVFTFSKEKTRRRDFSDRQLFLIDNTKYVSVLLLSTRKYDRWRFVILDIVNSLSSIQALSFGENEVGKFCVLQIFGAQCVKTLIDHKKSSTTSCLVCR